MRMIVGFHRQLLPLDGFFLDCFFLDSCSLDGWFLDGYFYPFDASRGKLVPQ